MKRFAIVLSTITFCLFFVQATLAADISVGVVDLNKVMETSPQSEDISRDLKKEFKARDEDLVAKAKQLKGLEDK